MTVALRPIAASDVPACREVFFTSLEELHERLGQPQMPRNPPAVERAFEHLRSTGPDLAWLAESAGSIVAFGIANRRGGAWFLSFLFVLPEHQGTRVGRQLLERLLPGDEGAERATLGTCVEAIQPVSTALYARYGMVPRVPLYLMVGRPRPDAFPTLPTGVEAIAGGGTAETADPDSERAVASLDRTILGYERAVDHASWRVAERRAVVFLRGSEPVGYGYAHPSGRIGPVAVRDPALLPSALGHLVAAAAPLDACQFVVPGPARDALLPLLEAGVRIDGAPAIYCASWQGPAFDRYLPNSFALL